MTEFEAEKSDTTASIALTSGAMAQSDADGGKLPLPVKAPIPDEMALSAGAADWIAAVQRIEHRDWSAILRLASDGFDGIVRNIAHFVQVDSSSSAGAVDVFQTASIADHQAPPARSGSAGVAWYMPSNMDALLAGVQVQSKMAALDFGTLTNPARVVAMTGDVISSGRPDAQFAVNPAMTFSPEAETITTDQPSTAGPGTEPIPTTDTDPPLQPELPAHSDIFSFRPGSGHVYVTDFDKGVDHILVTSDRFSSFEEMLAQSAVYQDEGSTVIEFHNGTDFLVLTHFSIQQLSADMFTFASQTVANPEVQSILGTDGNDVFELGAGDHIVDAGAGFDVITGGSGHDTFVFGVHSGHDFIVDFKPQDDRIQIDGALAKSFDDLMGHAAIYQDGGSAQIEFSAGQLITLYNTVAANVTADWFVFA